MKAIIFGSNGYIGKHLAYYLRQLGYDLFLYDIQPEGEHSTGKYAMVDVGNKASIRNIDFNVDEIYFFSGLTGTANAYDKYEDFIRVNEIGLLHLLDSLKQSHSKARLIFPSTRLVYKGKEGTLLSEEAEKECKSIYALNKFFSETLLRQYADYFGIEYTIFRICVPYGNILPGSLSYGTLGFFINKASSGANITLYGDGSQRRTFSYVADICNAIINVVHKHTTESRNQTYNIGGESFSLKEVAQMVSDKYGVIVETLPWPEIDLAMESGDTMFDSSKIEKLIGNNNSMTLAAWIAALEV